MNVTNNGEKKKDCLRLLQIKLWCYSHKKGWQVIDHSKKNHGNVLSVVVRSRNNEQSTIVYDMSHRTVKY